MTLLTPWSSGRDIGLEENNELLLIFENHFWTDFQTQHFRIEVNPIIKKVKHEIIYLFSNTLHI